MLSYRKSFFVLSSVLLLSIVTIIAPLRGQNPQTADAIVRDWDDESYGPIGDYSAPEPSAPKDRNKRYSESRRYNGRHLKEDPKVEESLLVDEWLHRLPAFPVTLSDAVLIADVADAQAYMSNDKTGIYTEFTVRIAEVLKDHQAAISVGSMLVTKREGGRIRFPSGHILRYGLEYQGMPRVGKRYVFFIRRNDPEETPYILTGYELRAGHVFPLDGVHQHRGVGKLTQFTAYENADEKTFLNAVRAAIAAPLPISPEQARYQ
jgi:hypothetical protein